MGGRGVGGGGDWRGGGRGWEGGRGGGGGGGAGRGGGGMERFLMKYTRVCLRPISKVLSIHKATEVEVRLVTHPQVID